MFGFGKKEVKAPEERLADLQRKKDWAGVSKAYYELGVAAMDAGDLHKAQLWLHRADTIYSADDNIYDKVGEKLMDDCSDRIGRLEGEAGLFYNAVPAEIEARAQRSCPRPRAASWPAPCCPTTTSAPARPGWRMSPRSRRSSSAFGATMTLSALASPGRRSRNESRIINSWIFWPDS